MSVAALNFEEQITHSSPNRSLVDRFIRLHSYGVCCEDGAYGAEPSTYD